MLSYLDYFRYDSSDKSTDNSLGSFRPNIEYVYAFLEPDRVTFQKNSVKKLQGNSRKRVKT